MARCDGAWANPHVQQLAKGVALGSEEEEGNSWARAGEADPEPKIENATSPQPLVPSPQPPVPSPKSLVPF